eukprot:4343636-Pyramimonas_sp.AAC.1
MYWTVPSASARALNDNDDETHDDNNCRWSALFVRVGWSGGDARRGDTYIAIYASVLCMPRCMQPDAGGRLALPSETNLRC